MHRSPFRTVTLGNAIAVLLLVLAIMVGFTQQGSAEPKPAKGSIAVRVTAQSNLCTVGGGSIEVSYTYSTVFSGAVTSATTKCTGGAEDGRTCVNTYTTVDCSKPFTQPTQAPFDGLPDTADPNGGDGPSFPNTTNLPGSGNGMLIQIDPDDPVATPTPMAP